MYSSSYPRVPKLWSPFAVTSVSVLLSLAMELLKANVHFCHMSLSILLWSCQHKTPLLTREEVRLAESFPQSGLSVGGKRLSEAVMAGND